MCLVFRIFIAKFNFTISGKFCELGVLLSLKFIGLLFLNKNSFISVTVFKLSNLFFLGIFCKVL